MKGNPDKKKLMNLMRKCLPFFEKDNGEAVKNVLAQVKKQSFNIIEMVNNQGFTLLHLAAYNNATKCFNAIVLAANSEVEPLELLQRKELVKQWVNI